MAPAGLAPRPKFGQGDKVRPGGKALDGYRVQG